MTGRAGGGETGILAEVSERDWMSDEVPEADAAEQLRPAADPDVFDDDVFEDPDRRGAPLESNESDWHEQHLIVEDPDPDEIR